MPVPVGAAIATAATPRTPRINATAKIELAFLLNIVVCLLIIVCLVYDQIIPSNYVEAVKKV